MKKISIVLLLIPFLNIYAQDVEFTASAPQTVQQGQQFRLVYSLNAKPKNFYAPDLRDFRILGGPSQSSSTSVQIINGKMTQSVSYTYTYILEASKIGDFTISPAKITVDRKSHESNSVKINVVKGQSQQPQQGQNQSGQQNQQQQQATSDDNLVYAKVHVNKTNVYQGEAIYAIVKFYSRFHVVNYGDFKIPKFEGFIVEDIGKVQPSIQVETINGVQYETVLFKKAILIPQMTGTINIEPFEWEVVYQKRVSSRSRSVWDDFFGGNYQNFRMQVKSTPVNINVKPLPANKPPDFTGAVGKFSLKTTIDKTQIKANDAITLKALVSGTGNIKFVDAPKINFPADFELYDPKINLNTQANSNGITGTKTFEYLIIPRHAGDYRIPAFTISYFDTETKQYKTLRSKEFNISVEKADQEDQSTMIVSGLSKEEVKFFGQEIRYIKTKNSQFQPIGLFVLGTTNFYLAYIVSFLVFMAIVIIWKNRIKQNANIQKVKNRKANKMATIRLKAAKTYMKAQDREHFHEEVVKAIWGYLSDKLAIPLSILSKETAKETLGQKSMPEEDIESVLELIGTCEYARYAPSAGHTSMEQIYTKAVKLISKLESKL